MGEGFNLPPDSRREGMIEFGLKVESEDVMLAAEGAELVKINCVGALEFGDTKGAEPTQVELRVGGNGESGPAEVGHNLTMHG